MGNTPLIRGDDNGARAVDTRSIGARLHGEFFRRIVRGMTALNGVDPNQTNEIPDNLKLDDVVQGNIQLEDLTKPPYRSIGKGFYLPMQTPGAFVGNLTSVVIQIPSGASVCCVIDWFEWICTTVARVRYESEASGLFLGGIPALSLEDRLLSPTNFTPVPSIQGGGGVQPPGLLTNGLISLLPITTFLRYPMEHMLYPGQGLIVTTDVQNTALSVGFKGRIFPLTAQGSQGPFS